jgi:hypothetical protein
MNRSERRAQRFQPRKATNPKTRPMSRAEKGAAAFVILIVCGALFFNIASGLCPVVTGKCLRCWWNKNPNCTYLTRARQGISHTHRHKPNVNADRATTPTADR